MFHGDLSFVSEVDDAASERFYMSTSEYVPLLPATEEQLQEIEAKIRAKIKQVPLVNLTQTPSTITLTICGELHYIYDQELKLTYCQSGAPSQNQYFLFSSKAIEIFLTGFIQHLFKDYEDEIPYPQLRKLYGKVANTCYGRPKAQAAKATSGLLWKRVLDPEIAKFTVQLMGVRADSYYYNLINNNLTQIQTLADTQPGLVPLWLMFRDSFDFSSKSSAKHLGYYFASQEGEIQYSCEDIVEDLANFLTTAGISTKHLPTIARLNFKQSRELLGRWVVTRKEELLQKGLELLTHIPLATNHTITRTLFRHEALLKEFNDIRPLAEAVLAWKPKKVRTAAAELNTVLTDMVTAKTGSVMTDDWTMTQLSFHERMDLIIQIESWFQQITSPSNVERIIGLIT